MKKAILTVLGKDKVGIVYRISKICFENNLNILEINQAITDQYFNMILILDYSNSLVSFEDLSNDFSLLGEELSLQIKLQSKEILDSMYRI